MTKDELIDRVGSAQRVAKLAGVTKQAVSAWRNNTVPLLRAIKIEQATGGLITAAEIRPDVFNKRDK